MSSEQHFELFTTKTGREIGYTYGKRPWPSKPTMLMLITVANRPDDQDFLVCNGVPVLGKLNQWELLREADRLEQQAELVERGEQQSADVNPLPELTNAPFWTKYLLKNPDFVQEFPELLNLVRAGDARH